MMGLLQRSWMVTLILGPIWMLSYTYDFGKRLSTARGHAW